MNIELEKTLKRATEYAFSLNTPYTGTEHFIASVLESNDYERIFGITSESYKSKVLEIMGKSNVDIYTYMGYTPALENILSNNSTIDDVLLDILLNETGSGYRILLECINEDSVYDIEDILDSRIECKKEVVKNTPNYLTNLNEKEYITNPAIGRDIILENIEKVLLKMNKPNVLLVGDAGVGKTAIVEGLAYNIKTGNINDRLKDYIIMSCSTSTLVAGTKYRGEFEEKINKLCDYLKKNKNIILFLDEMHTTINAGGAEGAIDMANILKPYLSRGDIKVIGATTLKESDIITKDSAYARRFTTILVEEPTITIMNKIVEKSIPKFESFYNLKIDKELVSTFVNESRELKGKFPDKCIDLLENVCVDILYNNEYKITKKDITRVAEEISDNQKQLISVNV